MNLLGVVVLYNPKENVWDNIKSYIGKTDKLILWRNSHIDNIPQIEKTIIMGDETNQGIGKALNEAVKYGLANGYTHLLTMDQDSYFEECVFENFVKMASQCNKEDIGCLCPEIEFNPLLNGKEGTYSEASSAITSGSIYPLPLFINIGMFREDFIIDAIDGEFSFRLREKGYKIFVINNITMNHIIGNKTKFKKFGMNFSSMNYPPIRIYYILRNHIINGRLYPQYANMWAFYKFFLLRRFCQILVYEPNKKEKLKAMFYGFYHGLKGISGPCRISFK